MFNVEIMALGRQIRRYRDAREWTLEALSEKSGVEVGTINALEVRNSERSKYGPAIAAAFGLTLEQMLDETRDPHALLDDSHLEAGLSPEEIKLLKDYRAMTPNERAKWRLLALVAKDSADPEKVEKALYPGKTPTK